MTDIENTVEPQNVDADDVPLTKQKNKGGRPKKEVLPKEKKPRTEKQTQALQKAMEIRKANIEQRKLQKKIEASKLLLSLEQPAPTPPSTPVEESSSEEEEKVQKVKAKKAPVKNEKKMKGKKIIIYQADDSSDSDSESESESDKEPKHFKTQQNKKSLIKVYNKPQVHNPKPIDSVKNYFAD